MLILNIFQSFQTMLLLCGEKWLWVNASGVLFCVSSLCVFFLLEVHFCLSLRLMRIVDWQIFCCNLDLRDFLLYSCKWHSKSVVFEQSLLFLEPWLHGILVFKDLECLELMLRIVWQFVFFLYIFVYNLLFFMYTSVCKSEMLAFDIWYSDLMDSCFVLSSFKNLVRSFILPVHIKNMSSINLR